MRALGTKMELLLTAPLQELRGDLLQQLLRQRASSACVPQTGQSVRHLPRPPPPEVFLQYNMRQTSTTTGRMSPVRLEPIYFQAFFQPHLSAGDSC